ncbi:4-hydroxybenzoyl-CoA thioesterase [Paenalcaligenes hominis]|uniref:4-hydroxybenzoyl-CoA thioesterase n=1 Tax=Paenalcaligenes hominis TaxID=643674 RepID=A0A1U9K162_9BURK|nr:thioesterase family protein [Paenalcaligenes hominis]AQS51724.1 4-hydroxybenzoyl-CoA thioesterase [Paenalcaligenes hominis]
MGSKLYTKEHRIRFSECDPAGIVFYPQYFVMFNNLMEQWVDTMIPGGFNGLIAKHKVGMPTVHLEANFRSISQMGDDVTLSLGIKKIGSRSLHLHLQCVGHDGVLRMEVNQVIVTTSLITHQATPVPEFLREPMQAFLIPQVATTADSCQA